MNNPNVVIIMARCCRSKQSFGIRLEEKSPTNWVADWAFPLKESIGKKEGYDSGKINGSFSIDDTYPGCPYCKRKSFCLCGGNLFSQCNKVGCIGDEESSFTCPWCGNQGQISGTIDSLTVGKDR